MPRVKGGTVTRRRRNRVLKLLKVTTERNQNYLKQLNKQS